MNTVTASCNGSKIQLFKFLMRQSDRDFNFRRRQSDRNLYLPDAILPPVFLPASGGRDFSGNYYFSEESGDFVAAAAVVDAFDSGVSVGAGVAFAC